MHEGNGWLVEEKRMLSQRSWFALELNRQWNGTKQLSSNSIPWVV